jgi:hypothetical protein
MCCRSGGALPWYKRASDMQVDTCQDQPAPGSRRLAETAQRWLSEGKKKQQQQQRQRAARKSVLNGSHPRNPGCMALLFTWLTPA